MKAYAIQQVTFSSAGIAMKAPEHPIAYRDTVLRGLVVEF